MRTTTKFTTRMNPLYSCSLIDYADFHIINEKLCFVDKPLNDSQITQFEAIIRKYKDYSIEQIDENLLLKDRQYMDLVYDIIK